MNPIMSMQVRLGFLESRLGQASEDSAFTSAFKDTDRLQLQNEKISESVSALLSGAGNDEKVLKLASDWEALKGKIQTATCGELRQDLQKVIEDVKDLFTVRTQAAVAEEGPSGPQEYEETETQIAHEVEHDAQMEEAKERALEKHPRTFEVFMQTLNEIRQGGLGNPLKTALEERDSVLFNMQTLLTLSLWKGDSEVLKETFSKFGLEHPGIIEEVQEKIKNGGVPLLEKILFQTPQTLGPQEAAFQSQLNSVISSSDMEYQVAQSILEYGGKRLGELDDGMIDNLPTAREEIAGGEQAIEDVEDLKNYLEDLMELPEGAMRTTLRELAESYIGERNAPFVDAIFEKMNEIGMQRSIYPICLGLIPRTITFESLQTWDAMKGLAERIPDQREKDGVKMALLNTILRSPPGPELYAEVDLRVPQMLSEAAHDEQLKREAVAYAAMYYANRREDIDRAQEILTAYFPEDKSKVLQMIESFATSAGFYQTPGWCRQLIARFNPQNEA